MKTNGTRRIVTFMLALVLVFTTVCVGTTEVEAAEKFTTIIAPTQTEQRQQERPGSEVGGAGCSVILFKRSTS